MSCSSSFEQLAHLQIPLEEVVSATDNFSDANHFRTDGFGKEYKGQLLRSGQLVDIVARRLEETYGQGNKEFWTEVSMLSKLEHRNLVCIIGFCDENGEKIVINKHESTRGDLYHYLRDPTLTWMQRLNICVGVAHALSYIYYDKRRDFSVIHGDIKCSKILLDDKWEAKLSGFELSMTRSTAERNSPCQLPNIWGVPGYVDPTYAKTGIVSHKSDMFSLGVVLIEVLCGRRTNIVHEDDAYLYQLAKSHYREGRLYSLVHPGLGKQMDPQSFVIFSEIAYSCLNEQPSERPSIDQIVIQLEKALESQREHESHEENIQGTASKSLKEQLAYLRIPLEEIVSATDNFSDANLIGEDGFGKEYHGQLLRSGQLVDIVARRLDETYGHGDKQFWMEVSMLSTLKHQNIISIIGFCDEGGEKIVINKLESTYGDLYDYLRDPTLTWMQRLQICVGVAHALSYIYYDKGRDFSIIHRDIKSNKILLDGQWEAKLSGFELSITQPAADRNRPCQLSVIWGVPGYVDPTYAKTGSVSHKSDMFSLGVVLIEVLCGKETKPVKEDEMYLYQSACSHYRGGRLYDLVHPIIGKQMGPQSFNIFSKTAYNCLNDKPSERPSIDQIVIQLEKALESQREHENRLISKAYSVAESITSKSFKYFAHLQLPLKEIISATNNFSDANLIKGSVLGKAYRGQLFWSEQPIDIVAQWFDREHMDQDVAFWKEISMLSTLEHKNIIYMLGFCDEIGTGKMIIYKQHKTKGSLETFLRDATLTWMRRLQICVDVAHALNYIYYDKGRDFSIIHCDIRSSKILLDDNWEAKLSGFELSLKLTEARKNDLCFTEVCGTWAYRDPTYDQTRSVTHKSDMYSLGVVLFEVLCGNKAIMVDEDNRLLAPFAKAKYEGGRLDDIINSGLRKQMDPQSFQIFSDIAYACLKEQRSQRPNIGVVVMELEKALESQRKHEKPGIIDASVEGTSSKNQKITLEDLVSATNDFSDENLIRRGGFGKTYKGQLLRAGQLIDIVARRLNTTYKQGKKEFLMEVSMLSTLKHENIVSMVGFCDEGNEKIIVNKHETHGSLDNYLRDATLTWMQRLEICVGVARALSYIHYDKERNFSIIHRNIKSSKILLDDNWKPKLSGFELSMKNTIARRHRLLLDRLSGTVGYIDPKYEKTGGVTHKSDVYSFGVVLFEVLCGRRAFNNPEWFSAQLAKDDLKEDVVGKLDELLDDHDRASHRLAKQKSWDRPNHGDADFINQQKGPSSYKNISKPRWTLSTRNLNPSVKSNNFSVASRTSSICSLAYGVSSGNSSELDFPLSPTHLMRTPTAASLIIIGQEEEPDENRPSLNPQDMCMFTLAPSARFHFDERLGHIRIPDEELLASKAISHYEEEKLYELIDPDLWKQMDPCSFNLFSKTAYDCLKEQRSERPDIHQILISLQEALDLQWKHEYPLILEEHSQIAAEVEGTPINRLKWKKLEHLKIRFHDIELATHNFSQTKCIGSGAYGKVYKAELEHFDSKSSSNIGGKNICDLPKICSTVAVKCLFKRKDTQAEEGFSAEIEMLTTCKHPNIVSLLGFCDEEGSDLILVYEFVSKGSLDDNLRRSDILTNLKWERRLQMCLEIAEGLNYLHTEKNIIHRDIKSDNILLSNKWVAKIADFGLSKIGPMFQHASYLETNVAGTNVYLDPEYKKTRKLKKASDIYSLGVVLFEILSGRLAYDQVYMKETDEGLAPFARQQFHKGTLKDMLDPKLKEEFDENIFTLSKGPNQDSLDTFLDIAYQCLAETQAQRPKIGTVVEKLKNALHLQKTHRDKLQISLEDIKLATDTFSDKNRIGRGGFGRVYKGEVTNVNGRHTNIAAKRLDKDGGQGETEFLTELEILLEYKHENVIGLLGYCNEQGERIIVYEYAPRGSLDQHLSNNDLTWRRRLEICIDIATALDFLHGGGKTQEVVMHRDIKSPNILLADDWKAKISDFGLSSITPINEDVIDNACGTKGYCDPQYLNDGIFKRESDIYSFGVLLYEILCGRLMFEDINGHIKPLIDSVKRYYILGKFDEMVFKGIKDQIAPESLATFQMLANECVHDLQHKRPTTGDVLLRLKQALEFQEDYEIWEPKLPDDHEEIFKMSNKSQTYLTKTKKELYGMLFNGILLHKGKVLFSVGDNGERNEMISGRKFLCKHPRLHKWSSLPESRFHKVAKIVDILNLNMQIKIKAQFLSPGVKYSVHLVFRFCRPRKSLAKRMYVNLKYKEGSESLHAYFATWREDGWMMTELCQFLNHKKDTCIEFRLESFSRCYCGSRAIYIEGIEFQAIDDENVKHEELRKNLEAVQLPTYFEEGPWKLGYSGNHEEFLTQYKVKKKKSYIISVKEALHHSSHEKLSAQSRSEDVIELQRQQVFRIKCKIESQRLSPNTDYACYLVFRLSKKCHGLHCPVIVRDLLKRKNKEKGIIYFRSPSSCNVNHTDRIPEEREDGWMEVKMWQFNSSNELRNNHVPINLKLICYEGTMFGLIISNLKFRPM